MAKVKSWREGSAGEPAYAADFEIARKAVLQVTDIKTNRNKYYAIELHKAASGDFPFRVYTHYGRTDDLESNPNAGTRESRYLRTEGEAVATYESIYRSKTSAGKGYREVDLASSRIGSHKARGTSSGHVDAKTVEKMAAGKPEKPAPKVSRLSAAVQDIVAYLYEEATDALTSTVQARITANGIETPLGVLTVGQVEKGERILQDAYAVYQRFAEATGVPRSKLFDDLTDLSGAFYTLIPHRIGRSRAAAESAVLATLADFEAKQETLQLMKDMLEVDGDDHGVLFDPEVDKKYDALKCAIDYVEPGTTEFNECRDYVERSQVKTKHIKVRNIYRVARPSERQVFDAKVGNERMLFHGSRVKNWVGILSRGILLPKIVVSMGVNRTDAGWLGNGIYFGDAACTSLYYTTPGKRKTRFMAIARVALGKAKQYTKITYGMNEAPAGYDSTHGVRAKPGVKSEFADDEYVVYRAEQQQLEYLVEMVG